MIWIFTSVLLWGLVHSILASKPAKEWADRRLGNRASRFYRLIYNIFAGVSFLPVLALLLLIPGRTLYIIPLPWSIFMVTGELIAVGALIIAFRQTDALEFLGLRHFTESQKPPRLTTSGLYRYVRHPLYTAGLAFIWLMPLMTVNTLAVNLGLSVYVIGGAVFEERKLQREFGQEYTAYMTVTPMFIPFLKGNKTRRESS